MYKYKCKCGYSGDYLVPHFHNNTARCPACSRLYEGVTAVDLEQLKFECPYCHKENDDGELTHYLSWVTCEHCGKNFEAKKRVRYFIK